MTDFLAATFAGLGRIVPDPADMLIGLRLRMPGPPPTVDTLRTHVARRVPLVPELTERLETAGWTPDPNFDVVRHVLPASRPTGPAHDLLDRTPNPPWILLLSTEPSGCWTLCYLVHHARQDLTAAAHTVARLLGDAPTRPDATNMGQGNWWRGMVAVLPDVLDTYRPTSAPSPVPSGRGRLLGEEVIDLRLLREPAATTGATVNQVHLTAMAEALRRWVPGWDTTRKREVLVPVNTRLSGEVAIGANRIGLMRVRLPSQELASYQRLRAVLTEASRDRTARCRKAMRALTDHAPPAVAGWMLRRITDPATMSVTVSALRLEPGLTVLGAPVLDISAVPWLPPGHRCFSLLVTHGERARLSVLAPAGGPDPGLLAAHWARAAAALHDEVIMTSRR